jgi:hypothetical protein
MIYRFAFLALAVGLFFFPSVQYHVGLDGADTEFYGFPLPWNSRGIAASVTKDIYVVPLLIDVVFFLALAYLLWYLFARRLQRLRPVLRRSILFGIWAYGGLAAATITVVVLAQERCFVSAWYDSPIITLLGIHLDAAL